MSRVLVIDREEGPAGTLASALEEKGYQVDRVTETESAYAYLRKEAPQVIIIDLMEEVPDHPADQPVGIKLMAQCYLEHPEIPIIVYSDAPGYREHFWSWAAAAHVSKEEGPEQVLEEVEELSGREGA
ncbi:MAG: response regulator [bacterium]